MILGDFGFGRLLHVLEAMFAMDDFFRGLTAGEVRGDFSVLALSFVAPAGCLAFA